MTSDEALAFLVAECNARGGEAAKTLLIFRVRTIAGTTEKRRVFLCRYCGARVGTSALGGRVSARLKRAGLVHQGMHLEECAREIEEADCGEHARCGGDCRECGGE